MVVYPLPMLGLGEMRLSVTWKTEAAGPLIAGSVPSSMEPRRIAARRAFLPEKAGFGGKRRQKPVFQSVRSGLGKFGAVRVSPGGCRSRFTSKWRRKRAFQTVRFGFLRFGRCGGYAFAATAGSALFMGHRPSPCPSPPGRGTPEQRLRADSLSQGERDRVRGDAASSIRRRRLRFPPAKTIWHGGCSILG
jgi:hypothetical protein